MTGWHGILSRHVLTVLLSLAGWLQNGCHSEKRTSGDCSSKMLSILKIEMIEQSDGTKSIFASFLLSSTSTRIHLSPQPSTLVSTPSLLVPCVSGITPCSDCSKAFNVKAETVFGQCIRVVGSTPESHWQFLFSGFSGKSSGFRVTNIIHKERQCIIFLPQRGSIGSFLTLDARLGNWDPNRAPSLLTDVSQRPV